MTAHMPTQIPVELEQVGGDLVQTRRRTAVTARVRTIAELTALAVVTSLPIALLVYLSAPALRAALVERDQAQAACSRIYDTVACRCAVEATIAAQRMPQAASDDGQLPARRVQASRVPITMTHDFVLRVQACRAGTRGPAD